MSAWERAADALHVAWPHLMADGLQHEVADVAVRAVLDTDEGAESPGAARAALYEFATLAFRETGVPPALHEHVTRLIDSHAIAVRAETRAETRRVVNEHRMLRELLALLVTGDTAGPVGGPGLGRALRDAGIDLSAEGARVRSRAAVEAAEACRAHPAPCRWPDAPGCVCGRAWEVLHHGQVVAVLPQGEATVRCEDEAGQACGDRVDALAWRPGPGAAEVLWLVAGRSATDSGWAVRPAGGEGRG